MGMAAGLVRKSLTISFKGNVLCTCTLLVDHITTLEHGSQGFQPRLDSHIIKLVPAAVLTGLGHLTLTWCMLHVHPIQHHALPCHLLLNSFSCCLTLCAHSMLMQGIPDPPLLWPLSLFLNTFQWLLDWFCLAPTTLSVFNTCVCTECLWIWLLCH